MKRKRCVLWLVLLTVLASPALAKGEIPPSPEALFQAFEAATTIPGSLGIPEPLAMTCSANQTCPNQCVVACTGSSTCTVQSTSVTCDGSTTNCPYPSCNVPPGCLEPCDWCACIASLPAGGCWRNCVPE